MIYEGYTIKAELRLIHKNNPKITMMCLERELLQERVAIKKFLPVLTTPSQPGSSRLYHLGVSQAQKAKVSGDERPRLRAS